MEILCAIHGLCEVNAEVAMLLSSLIGGLVVVESAIAIMHLRAYDCAFCIHCKLLYTLHTAP